MPSNAPALPWAMLLLSLLAGTVMQPVGATLPQHSLHLHCQRGHRLRKQYASTEHSWKRTRLQITQVRRLFDESQILTQIATQRATSREAADYREPLGNRKPLPGGRTVYWRPRLLRAAAFQRPGHHMTKHMHKVPRWVIDLPPLSLRRAWQRHRAGSSVAMHRLCPSPNHSLHSITTSTQRLTPGRGRSGPNSAGCRLLQLCLMNITSAAGARVPPTTVVGGGLRSSERGKHHGTAPREGHNLGSLIPKATKRAFRRARNRAAASLEGGTFYKGRWHARAALQALVNNEPLALLRSRPRQQIPRPNKHMDVRSICWNVGGLSGSCFQELVAWLDIVGSYDVVILQETQWQPSSDFRSGTWMCIHSSGYDSELSLDRHGGILIMIHQDVFQEPTAHEVYPGDCCTSAPFIAEATSM